MLAGQRILRVVLIAIVIGGCGKKEEQSAPVTPTTSKSVTATPTETPAAPTVASEPEKGTETSIQLKPADDNDDPQFALLFPTSDNVGGWVKTEAVKGGTIKHLQEYLPDLTEVLSPYLAETVCSVKYERVHQGAAESVRVVLIRAATSDDAYGMMSVSAPGADQFKAGEVRRQPGPGDIYIAKGPYFGIFKGQGDDKQHLGEGLELLTGKVMMELADHAELPMVIQVLQTEQLPVGTTMFVRDLRSLKGPAGKAILDAIGLQDVEAMNKLLRLGPKVDFAVATYTSNDWPGPDVIWLVKYPGREQSLAVAKQYRMILNKAKSSDRLESNTLLKGPNGRFLLGTWTLEAESLAHLMNRIQTYLPGNK